MDHQALRRYGGVMFRKQRGVRIEGENVYITINTDVLLRKQRHTVRI